MVSNSDLALDLYKQALDLDSRGAEAQAIPLYEQAISIGLSKKYQQAAHICLASSYRIVGRVDDSITILQKTISEYPTNLAAKVFLAMSYYANDQFQESTRLLLEVIGAKPNSANLKYFQRAIQFYSSNL